MILSLVLAASLTANVAVSPPDVRHKTMPRIAARGANEVMIWYDESRRQIEGAVNGIPFSIDTLVLYGQPVVAAGDENFIVAWSQYAYREIDEVMIARYSYSGQLLDTQKAGRHASDLEIAYGESSYLLSTHEQNGLAFHEISDAGEIRHVRTLVPAIAYNHGYHSPRIAWNGREFVIAFYYSYMKSLDVLADEREVWLTTLSGEPEKLLYLGYRWPDNLALAIGAGRPSIAVPHFEAGALLQPGREPRPWHSGIGDAQLVWNGSEFVLAWRQCATYGVANCVFYVQRLDASMAELDPDPVFSSDSVSPLAMAAVPGGVKLLYTRSDPSMKNIKRVYALTLDRLSQPRRRAAR